MENLIKILNEYGEISDYKINEVKTVAHEYFFVHEYLETVRSVSTTDTAVTVYADHDDKRGDSVFSVYASTSEEELREKIELALQKAKLVSNEPYSLPENENLSEEIYSNMSEYPAEELAYLISRACFEANCEESGSINALEIFVNEKIIRVVNSRGIDKSERKYQAMIEAIPTWNGERESVELYERYDFSSFDYEGVKAEIKGKMQEVKERYFAKKPDINPECAVVINAPEIGQLLRSVARELNYSSVYAHSNAFKRGDVLQEGDCDKITLALKGKIEGGTHNALFDNDGVTLKDTVVIEDGKAVNYYGSNRFAQYLKEEVTGVLPCMELNAGSVSVEEIEREPYFECVSMSGLQVDVYNDYIGGEVRLAYYFDGEKRVPLTGISVSGKLSEALNGMRLSREITTSDAYRGPKKAVFKKLIIV